MTIDQLKVFLENLTYAEFEALMTENPTWSVLQYVEDKDRQHAALLFVKWLNENRIDGGHTHVMWKKDSDEG